MVQDPYRYFRVEARELLEELGRGVLELEQGIPSADSVQKLLRVAHTLKGAARVVKQGKIAELAHSLEDLLAPLRERRAAFPPEQVNQCLEVVDSIRDLVANLSRPTVPPAGESIAVSMVPGPVTDEMPRTVRVDVAEMDALLGSLTEAAIEIASLAAVVNTVEKSHALSGLLTDRLSRPRLMAVNGGAIAGAFPQTQMVAEDLHAMMGEAARKLGENVERIGRRVKDARHRAEQLRLIPVRTIQPSLERVVRDTAQRTGKKVQLEMRGADVRLDADVLSAVQAALVQLVRNAVAHGIEPEIERGGVNKLSLGRITLEIQQDGRWVTFLCGDDGRGINLEAVRREAERRGIAPETVRDLGVKELLDLLLKGGVSTTNAVTEIAGRGVGLDLVRDTAVRLKGSVRVDTAAGRGTTVGLTVPITLAAMEALLFTVADLTVAIPLNLVCATSQVRSADLVRSGDTHQLAYEGSAVPFAFLPGLLARERGPGERGGCSAIIFQAKAGKAAIGADRLLGAETVVFRPLPRLVPANDLWMGTFLNTHGDPCVLLDPERAFDLVSRGISGHGPHEANDREPILIIDDSLTTRMLEQSILESAGYEVDLAVSGEEALQKARRRNYSLFLVDVEMPGMDGFSFVEAVRADPMLRKIPAIIVSSRSSAEDRRRGDEVGASGYVVKSEFEQKALLERIRRLVG